MTEQADIQRNEGVILFDGDCMLCSRWVGWVVRHDPEGMFRFTAIGSPHGRDMAMSLGIDPDDPDTNAVIIGGKAHLYSDAAIAILSHLPGRRWARLLKLIPKPLRDAFYKLVARNRIRWFGRPQACDLPAPDVKARIVEA